MLLLAAVVLGLGGTALATTQSKYIEAKDIEVANLATDSKEQMCAEAPTEEPDRTAAREELLSAMGGENMFLDALKEAENPDEVGSKIGEKTDVSFILGAAWPIILAILLIVFLLLCCWTLWPCCRCCRCCRASEVKHPGMPCKGSLFVALLVCFLGILIGGIVTLSGFDQTYQGFSHMACESAEFLDTFLSGSKEVNFVGMMNALDFFDSMDQSLDDGSNLMNNVTGIIDRTSTIKDQVFFAAETLNLLSGALNDPRALNPTDASGNDLYHECVLCKELAPKLAQASAELNSGVASALVEVRGTVDGQLSTSSREDMQDALQAALDPLMNFKQSMRDVFGSFIQPGAMEQVRSVMLNQVQPILLVFFFWSLLLFFIALAAAACFVVREKSENGYPRAPHRLTCCVFVCSCGMVIPVLILGGLLLTLTIPLSGLCLVMADMNGQVMTDISDGIGMNTTGDQGEILVNVIDSCLTPSDPNLNANMLDLMFSRNKSDPTKKISARNKMMDTFNKPIDAAFDDLDSKLGTDNTFPKLAEAPEIKDLANLLKDNPITAFILPVLSKIQSDAKFEKLFTADQEWAKLGGVSMLCEDHTPQGNFAGLDNTTAILGLDSADNILQSKGVNSLVVGCIPVPLCGGNDQQCSAASKLLQEKNKLNGLQTFPCPKFVTTSNVVCGADDFTWNAVTMRYDTDCWSGTPGSREMTIRRDNCSLADFRSYVENYHSQITKSFEMADRATSGSLNDITTSLRSVVKTHILNPIANVLDGITCGFMAKLYSGFVDSLCFRGVVGLRMVGASWVVVAVFTLFLSFVSYFLWRYTVDNVNAEMALARSEA